MMDRGNFFECIGMVRIQEVQFDGVLEQMEHLQTAAASLGFLKSEEYCVDSPPPSLRDWIWLATTSLHYALLYPSSSAGCNDSFALLLSSLSFTSNPL
ncbi:hypothetical protein K1719_007635 [Acacia pycnantha]|nr:hypothetical protein K1719_007635 [Acacia pycnantha]